MSILEATHREPECSAVEVHVGIAAAEVEVVGAGVGTRNRTAPIVAVGTNIEERTIAVVATARYGQLKRGSKGPSAVVLAPT